MKKIIKILLILAVLFVGFPVLAADVNLSIKDGNTTIFSGPVTLPGGTVELKGHSLDANSVLSVVNIADNLNDSFSITDLQYSDSFESFYLRCITGSTGEKCDNWQYWVNHTAPRVGMDKTILSGGENVYLYYNFGSQHKVVLSSSAINTSNPLTVTAQDYDYQNSSWVAGTEVTVGLTQPDPNNPWSPIEVQTKVVDENGQAIFSSIPAGPYNVGIKDDFYFSTEALTVKIPPAPAGGGIIFSPPVQEKPKFDTQKAFEFLISEQKENGSFGEDLYTDWTAFTLAGTTDFQDQKTKLIKYLSEIKTDDYQLTDYERHIMALMALGLNPYDINGINYVKKITDSFDGKQFGDIEKDNDDIFALIVLQNAGFAQTEKMVIDDVTFILSNQKNDGSWDESVDMTGAGIQALMNTADKSCFLSGSLSAPAGAALPLGSSACETPQNKELFSAVSKAKEFLKQSQKNDGGFGNISSTAWAIEGILALSEKPEDWVKNESTPLDYLALNQDTDGGMKNLSAQVGNDLKSKLWETAYAVSALSGKTWNQVMQKFNKQEIPAVTDIKPSLQKNEEKPPVQKTETPKKIIKKTLQKAKIPNKENLAEQNTATVINSLEIKNPEPIKKSWFRVFLDKIFSIF